MITEWNIQLKSGIEMYQSLLNSIKQAGGCRNSFKPFSKLEDMSVLELMSMLATNGIRFIYTGKTKEEKWNFQ